MAKASAGPLIEGVAGTFSGLVVTNSRSGLVIKRQARYKKHQNQAQQAVAERLKLAAEVWRELDWQQAAAWDEYAQTVTLHNPLTGQPYHPSGYNAFLALATKVLQVDIEAEVPVTPPVGVFIGDSLVIEAGSADFSPHLVHGLQSEKPRQTKVCESKGGLKSALLDPAILFTADITNSPGTTTELLLERLPNERRKPTGRFTSAGFHEFALGSLEVAVPVEPGVYVAGYRYVETATGRQTLAQVCGRVTV